MPHPGCPLRPQPGTEQHPQSTPTQQLPEAIRGTCRVTQGRWQRIQQPLGGADPLAQPPLPHRHFCLAPLKPLGQGRLGEQIGELMQPTNRPLGLSSAAQPRQGANHGARMNRIASCVQCLSLPPLPILLPALLLIRLRPGGAGLKGPRWPPRPCSAS